MAKFLTSNELNAELENIFLKADKQIILISPFIKLHERYISALKTKENNPELEIIIVFGKNEEDISKSMKQEDFDFFKKFPNIQIRYEKRLHAKYYANESSAILTSMNLYTYSQDNNIEAGVMTKVTLLGDIASNVMKKVTDEESFDNQALSYFKRVIEQSDLLFHRTPQFDDGLFNTGIKKKYKDSKVEVDKLTEFFADKQKFEPKYRKDIFERRIEETPKKQEVTPPTKTNVSEKSLSATANLKSSDKQTGYCIRTGVEIPFNVEKPMSYDAFKSWSKYSDPNYAEKFCHFSGEPSNGETSVSRPILSKNWKKAKEVFNL